jgi:plastocyanin
MNLFFGLIVAVGILTAIVLFFIYLEYESQRCDESCKAQYEAKGFRCFFESADYLCVYPSRKNVDVVVPWGSATMPEKRNFIPNTITVSLEINNTVSFTNVDDYVHNISSEGLFDFTMQPNQTRGFVFDKVGQFNYYSKSYPWLHGTVNVIPIDQSYDAGAPIEKHTNKFSEYLVFRKGDKWGFVKGFSIIDKDTILVSEAYSKINYSDEEVDERREKILRVGDKMIGRCDSFASGWQVSYLTLEKIDEQYNLAEFRRDYTISKDNRCNRS